jgi:hypothetical protein
VALADIECATTEPSGGPGLLVTRPQELLFGGALRTRLRVDTVDSKTELLVVSDPESVARATRTPGPVRRDRVSLESGGQL